MSIPFHISDTSLTFFAKGKSWAVASDHMNWAQIREGLLTATLTVDELIELADIKVAISNADPAGLLHFIGNELRYGDHSLANVWVDKVLQFRAENLPFDSIFLALDSLMKNPSSMARERFPLFAERNKFGFLPDGRMVAFKVVRDDYMDCYGGTFDNHVGCTPTMERAAVDDDPDRHCSNGLHLGALEYLPSFGMWNRDRRVVLCAFWPADVVAVPKDYNGTKMRVCKYEVIDDVDKKFVQEFVDSHQTVITDYDEVEDEQEDPEENDYDRGFELGTSAARGADYDVNFAAVSAEFKDGFSDGFANGLPN